MSWSGRVCDHLRDWVARFPGRIESYVWAEDIDLSAAAGALAFSTGTLKDVDKVGTDAVKLRKGFGTPEIIAILGIDEAGGGINGYLQIQGRARKIRFGKISQVAANEWWEFIPRRPIQVPEGSQLDVVGNKSGSGAEQHAVIVYIHYPKLDKPQMIDKIRAEYGPLGLKTGTRVAGTAGPWTAYPLTGFEDTELSFAADPSLRFAVSQLINGPGLADTSVVILRWPGQETNQYEIAMPASMGGSETIFNLPEIEFNADNPVKLGAIGAAVTSDEYSFVVSTNAPYGDTNAPSGGGKRESETGSTAPTSESPIAPYVPAATSGVGSLFGTLPTARFRR